MSQSERPQGPQRYSTLALDFGAALDSIFDTDDSLFSLSVDVQQKKEAISTQNKELEALEAQLKDTETRLKKAKRLSLANQGSSSAAAAAGASGENSQEMAFRNHTSPPRHAPPPIPHKISEASLASQYSAHQQTSRPMTAKSSKSQRPTTSQRA